MGFGEFKFASLMTRDRVVPISYFYSTSYNTYCISIQITNAGFLYVHVNDISLTGSHG